MHCVISISTFRLSQALDYFIEEQYFMIDDRAVSEKIKADTCISKLPDELHVKHAAKAWSHIWRRCHKQ